MRSKQGIGRGDYHTTALSRFCFIALSIVLLFFCTAGMSYAYKLPDTGQTKCYNTSGTEISCTGTGQDGEYNINPMSFTDNGNGTVTDNNTGLIWQKQDDGIQRTWSEAASYCENLTLGGYSDWRLPDLKEAISIFNFGKYDPAIDLDIFPVVKRGGYWINRDWWYFEMYDYDSSLNTSRYTMCVRGPKVSNLFVDNRDGTVTDLQTGLMWQKCSAGLNNDSSCSISWGAQYYSWWSALDYCNNLSLGGHTDWRLPNTKEL